MISRIVLKHLFILLLRPYNPPQCSVLKLPPTHSVKHATFLNVKLNKQKASDCLRRRTIAGRFASRNLSLKGNPVPKPESWNLKRIQGGARILSREWKIIYKNRFEATPKAVMMEKTLELPNLIFSRLGVRGF